MQTKRSLYMNEWIIKYLSPLRSDLLPCDETCNAFKLRSLRWVNRKRKFWCLKRGLIHGKRHQARVKRGQRCKKRSLLHRVGGKIDNLWKLSYLIYLNINVGLYRAYLFFIRINIYKHIPTQFDVGMYVILLIFIFKKS